jgi:putative sigma-54 modulation protein
MNYNLKGTGLQVTEEIRNYLEKKLSGADKFVAGDTSAHADVELEYAPLRDGPKYRAELTVSAASGLFRAESTGGSMHEAIDVAVATLERELRKTKKRRLHLVRRGGAAIKDAIRGLRDRF